jgi:trigger factor
LNATIENLDGDRVRLTVTVPADEVARAVSAAYTDIAGRIKVPGFRKGKVPRPLVDTNVGKEAVLEEAAESLVRETYPEAVEQYALLTAGRGEIGTLPELLEDADFTYSAELPIRPELTLGKTDGFKIEAPSGTAGEHEIDAQIDYLRDRFATLESIEDRGLQPDDFALISFIGKVDDADYEGNTVDKYLYELGRGQMPKEFDDALLGAKSGDDVKAEFDIPDTSSNPDFVGKKATFEVTVHEVKAKALPVADDEFASTVGGFDSLGELRSSIRAQLEDSKKSGRAASIERGVREAVAEELQGDIPQALVDDRAEELFEEFFDGLLKRDVSPEQYFEATGMTEDELRIDVGHQGASFVREELALEALCRAHGLEVTDEDVTEELQRIGESAERTPEDVRERLLGSGMMPVMRLSLMHRKAVQWLMDNVEVVDRAEPAPAAQAEAVAAD